jgi:hypothetical protein
VLQLLKEKQLYAKPSKCFFGVKGVEYLGHIVSHEGVKVDPNKIKAMMDWPISKTLKNPRGFLGLTGYYHKFVLLDHVVIDANGLIIWKIVGSYVIDVNGLV